MNLPTNIPPEHAIEAMLFASPTPVPLEELAEAGGWSKREVEDYVERLRRSLKDRSLEVRKVAGSYALLTKSDVAPFVERILQVQNKQRLTKVQLEILSIVAYKQPITRSQLEEARGINSDRILSQLVDLELVAQVGRAELPGRPMLFGTTELFLEHFGMSGLDDLPELAWEESDSPEEFSLEESIEEETPIRSREMQQLADELTGPSTNLQKLLAKIRKKEDVSA